MDGKDQISYYLKPRQEKKNQNHNTFAEFPMRAKDGKLVPISCRNLASLGATNVPGLEAIAWVSPPRGPQRKRYHPSRRGSGVLLLHHAAHV